jgi:hypothetical protein
VAPQQYTIVKNFSVFYHLAVTLWCMYKFTCQEGYLTAYLYASSSFPPLLQFVDTFNCFPVFLPVLSYPVCLSFYHFSSPSSSSFCTVGCLTLPKLNFYKFLYFERNGKCAFQIRGMWWRSWWGTVLQVGWLRVRFPMVSL